MKTAPGDLTHSHLDGDDCIEVELDLASYLAGGSLEDVPARLYQHLLGCPLCLQTALACMNGLDDIERLLYRLGQEREALGRVGPGPLSPGRAH
jgi:hypothetical protein